MGTMSTTPPQPPPDQPIPPPQEMSLPARRKTRRISRLIGISILVCLGMILPVWFFAARQLAIADAVEARDNMSAVGGMLIEFGGEYGSFPSASTALEVKEATGTPLTLGSSSSNQLFRQLVAAGGGASEKPFWAKTAISPKKPDDILHNDATALVKGECGFAYVAGLSARSDPGRPLLLCPLEPGKLTFDPVPFKGKAVILTLGHTGVIHDIDKHGRVIVNGMDIFDPKQPFWKGKTPDVKWPE